MLQEVLRYHPIVYHLVRTAGKDDVIPLSEPINTVNGEAVSEIPIGKGQSLMFSICAYNRYAANLRGQRSAMYSLTFCPYPQSGKCMGHRCSRIQSHAVHAGLRKGRCTGQHGQSRHVRELVRL